METAAHIRLVLWKAAKAIDRLDRASIAGTGLQISEFAILEVLLHKGPLAITTIGEKVLLTSGSMTAAIDRLEAKRLVKRLRDPLDGRRFNVHLTEAGRDVIEPAFEIHAANLEIAAGVLTPKERNELVRLLKKVGSRAEAAGRSRRLQFHAGATSQNDRFREKAFRPAHGEKENQP
jgi:MarR family 2-MHQ and catechol resistance regulon transcriptional repressor